MSDVHTPPSHDSALESLASAALPDAASSGPPPAADSEDASNCTKRACEEAGVDPSFTASGAPSAATCPFGWMCNSGATGVAGECCALRYLDPQLPLLQSLAAVQWKLAIGVVLSGLALMWRDKRAVTTAAGYSADAMQLCTEPINSFVSLSVTLNVYFLLLHALLTHPALRPRLSTPSALTSAARRSGIVLIAFELVSCVWLAVRMCRAAGFQGRLECSYPYRVPQPLTAQDPAHTAALFASTVMLLHAVYVIVVCAAAAGAAHRAGQLQQLAQAQFYSDLRFRANEAIANLPSVSEMFSLVSSKLSNAAPQPAAATTSAAQCPFSRFASAGAKCPVSGSSALSAPTSSTPVAAAGECRGCPFAQCRCTASKAHHGALALLAVVKQLISPAAATPAHPPADVDAPAFSSQLSPIVEEKTLPTPTSASTTAASETVPASASAAPLESAPSDATQASEEDAEESFVMVDGKSAEELAAAAASQSS